MAAVAVCRGAKAVVRKMIRITSQALDAHSESRSPLAFLSRTGSRRSMEFFGPARSWPHRATPALVASVRALPAANRRLVVEFGTWSAPWVMATLASIVHDCQDAARSQQHNCRGGKQGDFHCGSPTAKGPPIFGTAREARGRHGLSSASGTYLNTCHPVLLWQAKILH
jgi:hypothetical protein